MTNFRQINRLMGTRQEMTRQMKNGDFNDRLGRLMNRVDPYWEDREKTEMDIYERQAPVAVRENDNGEHVERTTHTARTPSRQLLSDGLLRSLWETTEMPSTDENGNPSHRQEGTIIASELLQKGQIEAELEALEA